MFKRSSGILMHISSLPSEYGIGDLGKKAYEFIDFLEYTGQKLWQILPLGPTGYGESPYQCYSAFAGNFLFIDMEEFVKNNYIANEELNSLREINNQLSVEYEKVRILKTKLLKKVYEVFLLKLKEDKKLEKDYQDYCRKNSWWLDNYALYMTFKEKFNYLSWQKWKKPYKFKDIKNTNLSENEKKVLGYYKFMQYTFYKQWYKLKSYANSKGIKIIGDIPIFVATDSADTWGHREIFQFTKSGRPKRIAGCPPDYFSKTGQLWGNVLYDWKTLKDKGYKWWIDRIKFCVDIYDIVRIDHFRGFESYWSIKYGEKTAIRGHWEKGPGLDLFKMTERKLGKLPIIAEDLGLLTPRVKKMLKRSEYPGMKVLEFAFDGEENDYLPHRYSKNSVAYVGTHDNDTVVGWYKKLSPREKYICDEYLKKWLEEKNRDYWSSIEWRMIESIWSSKAVLAIAQMQDIMGLDSKSRMNTPATVGENWKWRVIENMITHEMVERLKEITKLFNR